MNAVTLRRSDPAGNMHRYYRLDVQPDLFEEWCFIREWGRIGSAGQIRGVPYPNSGRGAGCARAAASRQGAPGECRHA